MNGPVHRRLVQDALFYMNSGNREEQQALWRLRQLAGGDAQLLQTVCEEADKADCYSDLQFYVPFPVMTDYAEYHGWWTTGLDHYVNAWVPPENWDLACGYSYPWSSQSTMDAEFDNGWINFLNVNIEDDPSKSLVLGRLPPYWIGQSLSWGDNWARDLPYSEYAPCSAVAATYYDHLINHYDDPMHVNVYGNMPNLQQLQKLGAILHFFGDAVVPQHVRGAHGFYHTEWENTVQTLMDYGRVGLNAPLVHDLLLGGEPFRGWFWQFGPLDGLYAVDYVIVQIAHMTREKVQSASGTDFDTLWAAADPFWANLLTAQNAIAVATPAAAPAPYNCMNYLYNLGVAGCVHTLRRASEDLLMRGVGPAPPEILRLLPIAAAIFGGLAHRPRSAFSVRPELLLRFAPTGQTPVSQRLSELEQVFAVDRMEAIDSHRVSEVLATVQEALDHEFLAYGGQGAQVPDELSTSFDSGFGLYAFRPPTIEECTDERQYRQYLAHCEIHRYKIHLLNLTARIAYLNAEARRRGGPSAELEDIARKRQSLERVREQSVTKRAIPRRHPTLVPQVMRFIEPGGRPLPPNIRVREG